VLNGGLNLPTTMPGVILTSSPGFDSSTIARQLLRTGVFNVSAAHSPLEALREALASVSPDTRGSLWLTVTDEDEDGPALLSVRCRKTSVYSLHASLRRYDRIRPGLLGGLLNQLRCAARATAPMFTPYDALRDASMSTPFDPREDTVEETRYRLRHGQCKALPEPEWNRRMETLTSRDAAKLMAKDGRQTYLEDHKLGWTLGTPILSTGEVNEEIGALPADLKVNANRLDSCTRQLAALNFKMPPDLSDPRFEEFGSVNMVFLATGGHPNRLGKDALSEYFDDLMQQKVHMLDEADSWPLWSIPIESQNSYRAASQALLRTARAQQLVHTGLMALGAQKC
jgi:hypothetical protein